MSNVWSSSKPDVEAELGPVQPATLAPQDPGYWTDRLRRDEARLTHRIKTIYGYHILRRLLDNRDQIQQADAAFLHLMA